MANEELKTSAVGFGFSDEWVAKVVEEWGDDVLTSVVEMARHGLSVEVITQLLEKFGPRLLDLLVSLLNRLRMVGVSGDVIPGQVVEGVDAAIIDVVVQNWLPIIIQKYLPMIIDKYGEQLIKFVIDFVIKSLNK